MLRNIFEGIGAFGEWTFGILKVLGNSVNYVFMLVIAAALIYWMAQMVKHQKAGEK